MAEGSVGRRWLGLGYVRKGRVSSDHPSVRSWDWGQLSSSLKMSVSRVERTRHLQAMCSPRTRCLGTIVFKDTRNIIPDVLVRRRNSLGVRSLLV